MNYRTENTPGDNNIENNHVYLYDKNGNLIYVNTGRMMNDGHNETGTGERKLIWDEENRLLAVDDNGFVSNYWYDADGERTVKTSGESDQVYVNGVFSGGSTNTAKFSLYVSPYLVANQGGRYTKHIYAGSQRIVSKIGDFASYGSDPRRIEYAGANTDGLSVDYKAKYAAQQQVIKDNYKFFDVPYNGTDNDNYADGEGFCCNDGSMEAAMARTKAQARTVARSFKDPDNYENLQFFYHPDHLGSSSFITNLDGEVVQHIEYVPFGEVFIEERNNVWNTPYLFNAKEFDEETGMYYYGARYYDPRLSLWMSTDPKQENYPGIITYCYSVNNPIIVKDPSGKSPVYSLDGEFLGTDDKGLAGAYLIMDKAKFKQGMSSKDARNNSYLGPIKDDVRQKIWDHHAGLVERPDFDGFVTINEGVDWAKKHPNALSNPTPDNTLYIDTSKLDFGPLSTDDFKEENVVTAQNLFSAGRFFGDLMSEKRRGTVYALGAVNMILINRGNREVVIVNDDATDYDWNNGGSSMRKTAINLERIRTGINDNHGFKVFYYGIGKLHK